VMVSGNITRSAGSSQLLADILNRPVGMVTEKSPAAYGAALLARRPGRDTATGRDGVPRRASFSSTEFRNPSAAQAARYDVLYQAYCEVAARCA